MPTPSQAAADRSRAEALFFEGTRLWSTDPARAQDCFIHALQLAPDFAQAHANLGLLLSQRGADEAAEAAFRRALALRPDLAEAHLNFGGLLLKQKRFAEAESAYTSATRLAPQSPAAWSNLGALYLCTRHDEQAEACLRKAIALDASFAKAQFNLSHLLLRQGRFEEGWRRFECRDWYAGLAAKLSCPRWRGESLVGKKLLIGYEAGYGDMIQFIRYAEMLKAQGAAHLSLLCHPALKTLLATMSALDSVIGFDESLPAMTWDCWTPLMSIPCHCATRLDTIPAQLPYLHPGREVVQSWAAQLPASGLRVGLAWKGNPQFENDADRSLASLAVLSPLAKIRDLHFISLQKGSGEHEAAHPACGGLPLHPIKRPLNDFLDTAALVVSLDLVISVDTAVAHLAGALGKPCWVLLPHYKTDWRWMQERADSPWYPGVMRLFRQTAMGDWASVIDEVKKALEERVAGR